MAQEARARIVFFQHRDIWACCDSPGALRETKCALESGERPVDRRVRRAVRLPFRYIGRDAIRCDFEGAAIFPKWRPDALVAI